MHVHGYCERSRCTSIAGAFMCDACLTRSLETVSPDPWSGVVGAVVTPAFTKGEESL